LHSLLPTKLHLFEAIGEQTFVRLCRYRHILSPRHQNGRNTFCDRLAERVETIFRWGLGLRSMCTSKCGKACLERDRVEAGQQVVARQSG
jgi:hypothetical protein